jgi:hypothetical protein
MDTAFVPRWSARFAPGAAISGLAITNKPLAGDNKRALVVSRIAPAIEWKVTTPLLSLGNPEERDPPSPRLLRGSVDLVCLFMIVSGAA